MASVRRVGRRKARWLPVGCVAVVLCGTQAAQAATWNLAGGGSWNTAGNWNPASIPNAVGANATFNNAASVNNPAQTANRTVTADIVETVGAIIFNNDQTNTFTTSISTGPTNGGLIFDAAGAGPATISVPAALGTGNFTISAPITLNDQLVATVDNTTAASTAGALNLTAAINGAGGFTKGGVGLATFGTGAKTYTGPTVINGGRMRISNAARPVSTSGFTINNGGQLDMITAGTYDFGSGPMNLNGAGPTTGSFAAFPGAIRNDSGLVVTVSNAVVLQSDTLIHVQGSTGSTTLAGNISGPGKLTLTSQPHDANLGTLVLNGTNTYSGGTIVDGGTLVVSGAGATLGTGNVTVNSASLSWAGSSAKLTIQSGVLNAIADTATLSLAGGNNAGVADDGYAELGAGVNEVVGGLVLGGVPQGPGTYGSSSSSATFKNDEYFTGTGVVTVRLVLTIRLSLPNVVLSWPTNVVGFALQAKGGLTGTWTNDTHSVAVSGTNYIVTEPKSSGTMFFRLKK